MQEPERAGPPDPDVLARFTNRRVEAVDERDGGVQARGRGGVDEALRPGDVYRQRLLADHVLAGRERRLGEREMQVVGRADVNDVDPRVAGELVGRVEGPRRPELVRGGGGRFARRGGHAGELGARQRERAGMDSSDESRSCDPGL